MEEDLRIKDNLIEPKSETDEKEFEPCNGFLMIFVNLFCFPLSLIFCCICGFFQIQPRQSNVLTLCGKYKGTIKQSGFFWVHGLYTRTVVPLSLNNLNGHEIKVNDKSGNPIEIAAVVVWRVKDTAKAIFDVADYNSFVVVQYESALRELANRYSYEQTDPKEISLRSGNEQINRHLVDYLHDRLDVAGIEVVEARITTLAYSEEIAAIMLRRQQAEATLGAKEKIVNGAVDIIEGAIARFKTVKFSASEQSTLANNLLVVLCSETGVQPTLGMKDN